MESGTGARLRLCVRSFGSEDGRPRCAQEALQQQIGEADAVTALCALGGGRFAYTLANRTLGVYAGVHRAWRVKSKQAANCLCAAELRGDGETQLLSGWVNGKARPALPW